MRPETSPPLLVVCGLAAEAGIAAGPGVVALAAPPAALRAKLDAFGGDVAAVVSFGLAGGLAEHLRAGTLVVSSSVRAGNAGWPCDAAMVRHLHDALEAEGFDVASGATICREAPVLSAREKAMLHRDTGAVAVDMESHLAAAFAREKGVPFVVLRAVCDTATNDLPPLAVRAIGADGRLDWRAIGAEIAARPGQLAALPGTALATRRALRSLSRARRFLGPRFGL